MGAKRAPCGSCNDLVFASSKYAEVKSSPFSMLAAIDNGCQICKIIWSGLEHFGWKPRHKDNIGRYRRDLQIRLRTPSAVRPLTVLAQPFGDVPAVEFFTLGDNPSPWPAFIRAGPIAPLSDSTECFDLLNRWIAECDQSHVGCKDETEITFPSRVIDINYTGSGFRPFLYEPTGNLKAVRFAALSYCWGAGRQLKTLKQNLQIHRKGIEWSAIPRTIQDAVLITHNLDLKYLWVDALAIVQDDAVDWAEQSAKMGQIYSDAHVTIIASLAEGCQTGIFTARTESASFQVWPMMSDLNIKSFSSVFARQEPSTSMMTCPVVDRAWILQEHLLSKRTIQYHPSQLLWQCRLCNASESRPTLSSDEGWPGLTRTADGILRPIQLEQTNYLNDMHNIWKGLVANYTRRLLTCPTDKLPAISGLAKKFQPFLGSYVAGSWETDLLSGLVWVYRPLNLTGPRKPLPEAYVAPTWSWASTIGPVEGTNTSYPTLTCALVDVSMIFATSDLTGSLRPGSAIVVRGHVVEGTLEKLDRVTNELSSTRGRVIINGKPYEAETDDFDDPSANITPPSSSKNLELLPIRTEVKVPCRVSCLEITREDTRTHKSFTALILIQSRVHSGAYERVGLVYIIEKQVGGLGDRLGQGLDEGLSDMLELFDQAPLEALRLV